MYCRKCGKEISDDSSFCCFCGISIDGHYEPQKEQSVVVNLVNNNTNQNQMINRMPAYVKKSKWTAFILCLLFGWLGAHRFYVGKNGSGLIWLFTCGIFGLGWLVDTLLILCNAFRDSNGIPLQ